MADTENIAVEAPAEPEVSVPASQPAAPASLADPASTDLLKQILEQNQKQTKYLKKVKNLLVLCLVCLLLSALVAAFVAYKVVPPAVTLLNTANAQVQALDMKGVNTLITDTNALIADTTTAISGLQQALNSINGIDFQSLNEAITSLKNIASSFDIDKLNGAIDSLSDSVDAFGKMVENMSKFRLFG